jgi:hypothetical protein
MEREAHMNEFVERKTVMVEVEAQLVAENGLGFGEGGISGEERKSALSPEHLVAVETAVNSPEILVEVSKDKDGQMIDDDGCGDGRLVTRIFEGAEERLKSLRRPKVFGGGATMATASQIGLGRATGKTLRDAFSSGMSRLRDKQVGFGAHTDTHAHGPNCGCGAIDKAPIIIENALKFQEPIRDSIAALGIDTDGLDEVFGSYRSFAETMDAPSYTGKSVMEEIIDNGKIVKELDDDHKEMIVILNLVEGYTVDQEKIREVTDGQAQAFAVDVWRVKLLAERLYDGESVEVQHRAFLSELVYTLATAGTLTKGDLPVYVVNKQPEAVAA